MHDRGKLFDSVVVWADGFWNAFLCCGGKMCNQIVLKVSVYKSM